MIVKRCFRLSDSFVEKYKTIKPPFGFNGLGELTYMRTYSRLKEDGTNEKWYETVRRVVEGTYSIQKNHIKRYALGWDEDVANESAEEMFDRIFYMKFLPPGRGLWAMGTDIIEKRGLFGALQNCGFVSTENLEEDLTKPFEFLMDMSMLGAGIGFDVKGAYSLRLYGDRDKAESAYNHVISDTREGWVKSLKALLEFYFGAGPYPVFDYTSIRPKGAIIKTFGGRSAGYEVLEKLHKSIENQFDNRSDLITETDIVDIMNKIGVCVVAGNVRRCLPKGTLIHCSDGLKKIEDVKKGDLVWNSKRELGVVSELVYQGKQPVIGIETQLGIFECTEKHKIAVMDNVGSYVWKKANELSVGDRLVFPIHEIKGIVTELPEWSYEKPKKSTTCQDIIIPKLNDEIAWFLGMFHGDGNTYPNFEENGFNAYVSVASHIDHTSIIERLERNFKTFGVNTSIIKNKGNWVRVNSQSKQLAWYFSKFKKAKEKITVPDFIMKGEINVRASYLAGLFDADGSSLNKPTVLIYSIYEDYVKEIQALYASLGIPTRINCLKDNNKRVKKGWNTVHTLNLVGQIAIDRCEELVMIHSEKYNNINKTKRSQNDYGFPSSWIEGVRKGGIDFHGKWNRKSKQMTVAKYIECGGNIDDLIPIEVLDIVEENKIVETYDISVPQFNEFIAQEGLLVHNTAEIVFGSSDSEEYLKLKDYRWDSEKGECVGSRVERSEYGWTSNNSIFAEIGQDYSTVASQTARNGEPGYVWLENMQRFSRMGKNADNKDHRVMGANPCVPDDTWILTKEGRKQVKDLISIPFVAIVNGEEYECKKGFFQTGSDSQLYKIVTEDGREIEATDNHKFLVEGKEWIELKDLNVGDKLTLNLHGVMNVEDEGDYKKGWLLGNFIGDGNFTCKDKNKCSAKLSYWGENKEELLEQAITWLKDSFEGFKGEGRIEQYKDLNRPIGTQSIQLAQLALKLNVSPESKTLTDDIEKRSQSFLKGLVSGLFDADGYVSGESKGSGIYIGLSNTDYNLLLRTQRILSSFGILSYIRDVKCEGKTFLPDGKGGEKEYKTKSLYDLRISGKNVEIFKELVGFTDSLKNQKLKDKMSKMTKGFYLKNPFIKIQTIEKSRCTDVYDCTIEEIHRFDANGIIIHNCVEQSLESYELCCLVETFPTMCKDIEDYKRTLKFAYLYAKTVTLGQVHWWETNRVLLRNRRIGTSISGIAQFLAKKGIDQLKQYMTNGYDTIQAYDTIYSEWLCVPKSIKTTSIKPSGTVSLLPGVTPGIHHPENNFYIRRIRLAKDSPFIQSCIEAGLYVEDDVVDSSSVVVEFPVSLEGVRTVDQVSIWEQASLAAFAQKYWADNQVSCTITVQEHESDQIEHILNYFQYQMKGVSFLPKVKGGSFPQMPYEAITKEEYVEKALRVKPLNLNVNEGVDSTPELYCNNDTCVIP